MDDNEARKILSRMTGRMVEDLHIAIASHKQFLLTRLAGQRSLAKLASADMQPNQIPHQAQALFSEQDLNEFAVGSISACFGPEFNVVEGRRYPRIPNSHLLLFSRVLTIEGVRGDFHHPAVIHSQWDVPDHPWFSMPQPAEGIPMAVWMEAALQPCGFLSAWLGTMLCHPSQEYFFRNLDGTATLHSDMDVRGKTVTCRAEMTSSIMNGTTTIQRFRFYLTCGNILLFDGTTVFGYFPPEMMSAQKGLDGGPTPPPDSPSEPDGFLIEPTVSGHRLNLLDELYLSSDRARLTGKFINFPSAWFYRCHFYEDPVMPGSLGVETVYQALRAAVPRLLPAMPVTSTSLPLNRPLSWKYRGQILPSHRVMSFLVENIELAQDSEGWLLCADASLWADNLRIYAVQRAAIRIRAG